ncbi:MAG: radical SAM family heme chaperone HemW [Hymenobacteraceae bacterium]|nr:radical SAM family heme chaperone HemW [Hymenobacteraceae bacterium]
MAGLYLHIPFCRQACHYCDFHFSTSLARKPAVLTAITKEIELRARYFGPGAAPLTSLYFGGGTPSLLTAAELNGLFAAIERIFGWEVGAEITLEANPHDLTPAWLAALRGTPVNRLSIGIQSFHEPHLRLMNRAHSAAEALACVRYAQDAGFANLSIDLIYGIPAPDHTIWQHDLATALSLNVPHVSAYALTVEPRTALGRWTEKGRFRPSTDEFTAQQFEQLTASLTAGGYAHYEISNFARPGAEARHNSAYWQGTAYVGIGPSAHSFDGYATRQANVASNTGYVAALERGEIPATIEHLSPRDLANEYLLTSLRTSCGTDLHHLREHFGRDLATTHAATLADLTARGLATVDCAANGSAVLRLTSAGRLLADDITLTFFEL